MKKYISWIVVAVFFSKGFLGQNARAEVDLTPFFKQLAQIQLNTTILHNVYQAFDRDVVFQPSSPSDAAFASWGYLLHRMYLPEDIQDPKYTFRVKHPLDPNLLSTVVHEFAHAYAQLFCSEGSPQDKMHVQCKNTLQSIWADIVAQEIKTFPYVPYYPWLKAMEIQGYYIQDVINQIFADLESIEHYNLHMTSMLGKNPHSIQALGDQIIVPKSEFNYLTHLTNPKFDYIHIQTRAYFNNALIPHKLTSLQQENLFRTTLWLDLPKNPQELLERLMSEKSTYGKKLRKRILEARTNYITRLRK